MTVLNQLDRFDLVQDVINRLPQLGDKAAHLKQEMQDTLIKHSYYIRKHGLDMPEVKDWLWKNLKI